MTDTNERLAIVTDTRRARVMQAVRWAIGVLGHCVNVRSTASRGSRFSIIAARAD